MAEPIPSPILQRLATSLRLLSLRSDIDNIILELLGLFSLEKIYSEGDQEKYQALVVTLLIQLNAIFSIQRLSLPTETLHVGWYLEFLASYEVTFRAVEYVLQIIVEGRETLGEARLLRDKYLTEFLLNALRFITLHPRIPSSKGGRDQRDRFARIHKLLERIIDNYPHPESPLLLVCRETTDSLRTRPNGLQLPARLKAELPNVATKLYPLPKCLHHQYVSSIIPQDGSPGDWLSQFFALRDITQFVVGASAQYVDLGETRDMNLQATSAKTRDAVLHAIESVQIHPYFNKADLASTFAHTFRAILVETPKPGRKPIPTSYIDDSEMDALDALHTKLSDRQIVNRASDHEMISTISKVTREIELLDDPNGLRRGLLPKSYAVNCKKCHIVGDSQLRPSYDRRFSFDDPEEFEIILPLRSKCIICGEGVTMMREIVALRRTWDMLKPLESNFETTSVERHDASQFKLAAPKFETGAPLNQTYSGFPPDQTASPVSPDRSRSISNTLLSPASPGIPGILETPRTEISHANGLLTIEGVHRSDSSEATDHIETASISATDIAPMSTLDSRSFQDSQLHCESELSLPLTSKTSVSSHAVSSVGAASAKRSSKWTLMKLNASRKASTKSSGDSSTLSSTTSGSQKLEEISLKGLMTITRNSVRGRNAKNINVAISQNSTYVLFWTQACINIWDVRTSSPILGRQVLMDSNCLMAATTRVHLAYMIGTRDKLTLRIVNLIETTVPVVEYKVPSSSWCQSIAICPTEKYVVVGFDNSVVRFFETKRLEEPREERLHARHHANCSKCPPVDTLSFSNDGHNLLASTRNQKSGLVQVFLWRFPFLESVELVSCRYQVPVLESEDNGVSSATFRSGIGSEEDLVCITTWTQSGIPILIQPQDGHRTDIKTHASGHQGKPDTRIQCAAFSPTGRELALVNSRGNLYYVSSLNSSPMDIKKIAKSKELTTKTNAFAMAFMSLPGEDAIVLAWVDVQKSLGYVQKIPIKYKVPDAPVPKPPIPQAPIPQEPRYELATEGTEIPRPLPKS